MRILATLLDEGRAPLAGRAVQAWISTTDGREQSFAQGTTGEDGRLSLAVEVPAVALKPTSGGAQPLLDGIAPTYMAALPAIHLRLPDPNGARLISRTPVVLEEGALDFGTVIVREGSDYGTFGGLPLHGLPLELHAALIGETLPLPDLRGASEALARRRLTEADFVVRVTWQLVQSEALDGRVVAQRPAPEARWARRGSVVEIALGRAPRPSVSRSTP